jgi:hypothetical protein
MKHTKRLLLLLCLLTAVLSLALVTAGQTNNKENAASASTCDHENALNIIQQQIDATRTFDDAVDRITVLLRAADLLWPDRQDKARATFFDAFVLATVNFKEKGDEDRKEGVALMAGTPDQRYRVISAIARRDYPWAKKLTDQVLKQDADDAKQKTAGNPLGDRKTPGKILNMASSLLTTDSATAVNIARTSFGYTATLLLPMFMYRLAEMNQTMADQFYQEALSAYSDKPMEEFLYLSAYPFGNTRDAGEMPGYTIYRIPQTFTPNNSLQRLFVKTLLRRAQQAFETPSDAVDIRNLTENAQIWLALTRLQKQIQESLPDLAAAAEQARANGFNVQSQKSQNSVTNTISQQERPKKTFDERVEAADKERSSDDRNRDLVFAITAAPQTEALDHVLGAADKIDDSKIKEDVLNWLYFNRAQLALNNKQLDDARRLAAKVSELDQRAYLYSEIAKEALNHAESQQQAREILDEVFNAAGRAPNNSMSTARTLLAVAYLYSKIDLGRAVSALGDAVKCINRIEAPDFSRQSVSRRIEGKNFGTYAAFQTPGFSPENVFREMAKLDLDGALYQANNLTNKSLRSLTTLALVESCMTSAPAPGKPEEATPRKAGTKTAKP